jgi:ubiquinone/menaquinone biosynthesis C-methylase UbiE
MQTDELILLEKTKYEKIWELFSNYRALSPAEDLAPFYLKTFNRYLHEGDRLIDFGCGTGRAAKTFLSAHLQVDLVDFCSNCLDEEVVLLTELFPGLCRFWQACLWDLPPSLLAGEWGFCCDVLEHIPPEKVNTALESMASRIIKGALFSIFLTEDEFGSAIGVPLHLTLASKDWWRRTIQQYFPHVDLLLETPEWVVFQALKQ